jgi:hypothetical protein
MRIIKRTLLAATFVFLVAASASAQGKLLYSDDFDKLLNSKDWIAEMEPAPNSAVYTQNGGLVLNTRKGVTVWFNKLLKGDIEIDFDRTVLVDTGRNDRLSDLNQFWGASDPHNANLFTRSGKLEDYDALSLYYIGMGGNTNKTTRFRKYLGDGTKPLIQEYIDAAHLLVANKTYHIKIVVAKGVTSYWVDGQCYFTYTDAKLLQDGYFGFRSTWSRQVVRNFRIYRL